MEANFKATTNIISPNEEWYFKQSLFSYWISSSHNTYLPYDQILGRSSICYYRLQLMFYYGGCVEIDTYGVTDKGDDIIIQHLPSNSGGILLRSILDIVVDVLKLRIKNEVQIKSGGPIILTFDNKKLKKKSDHDVFWKIISEYADQYPNYFLIITDDLDLSTKPISEYYNKILIRWGENNFDKCSKSDNVGNELCQPSHNKFPSFIVNKTNPSRWVHLGKSKDDFASGILNNTKNKSISVQVKDGDKFISPSIFIITNTFNNIMRMYPSYKNVRSSNYVNNMMYFAMGVQIVALNLQTLNESWFYNKAIFMPPNGIPCKNSEIEKSTNNCHLRKIKYKLVKSNNPTNPTLPNPTLPNPTLPNPTLPNPTDLNPLAYRLKPLWLLGLLHYPEPYNLKLTFSFKEQINFSNLKFNVKYCLDHNKDNKNIKIVVKQDLIEYYFLKIDPTVSVFYLKFMLGDKKYKNGFEIPWYAEKLDGSIDIDSYSLSKSKKSGLVSKIFKLSGDNYNNVTLNDKNINNDCMDDTLFNFDDIQSLKIKYSWAKLDKYQFNEDIKKYNEAITTTRSLKKYSYLKVEDFLTDLKLFQSYKLDLMNELLKTINNKPTELKEDDNEEEEFLKKIKI
jgi:Phosphatidylinositol-specific phospholipase C, Y domain/Phosphatidylinositol-specific phospholipase C, X domain